VPLDIPEEVAEDVDGDDVPDVLRVKRGEGLEGHAHELVVLVDHGAPAVAAVDGRVDLDGQERLPALRVLLQLDARHHAGRHGERLAADGVAHLGYGGI